MAERESEIHPFTSDHSRKNNTSSKPKTKNLELKHDKRSKTFINYFKNGRGNRGVKVSDHDWPCHVFDPSTTKDPPSHVTTLEEDLKHQPICQDSPKDVLSDSGLEIELAIPFVPNRDPPDTPQQSELGEFVHYHPSE
ncbi:uncharacterized protein TNCV_3076201 [Trichonephila clavipes]|nr:uncharacterized protein TNCV_3076201 [Trichonephila clavipes]